MWENGAVRRCMDCSRILPVSESISSMFEDGESGRRCRISSLACQQTQARGEQLLVGTTHGVVVVLDSAQLCPLTSFRTYGSAVEAILCANGPAAAERPAGRAADEVPKMAGAFFVTIGRKYRNLIKRLAPNVRAGPPAEAGDGLEEEERVNYAIVWQGEHWA